MTTLLQIGENEYRVSGSHIYTVWGQKSVVIDGETYHRNYTQEIEIDYDQDFEGNDRSPHWRKYEFDELAFLGHTVIVWDFQWNGSAINRLIWTIHSANIYAQMLCHFGEIKLFGPKILDIFTRRGIYYDDLKKWLFEKNEVCILLTEYAGGNGIYCTLPLKDFIDLELPNPGYSLSRFYETYIPELAERPKVLTDETRYQIADRLLNFQTFYFQKHGH